MDTISLPRAPSTDPSPVFPTLPTTTAKNITRVILILSSLLVGVGGMYAKELETDPDTAAVIAERINIPGLVTAGTGILGIMLGLFQQKQHTDQATVAVAQAAASPPVDANGNQSHEYTLSAAVTQAIQRRQFDDADRILKLIKDLGTVVPDPEEV